LEMVGRGGDCEVELNCPKVSLFHCVLFRESNRLWCIDLGSGNGTLLNGQRIECALVELGARLRIGDFELEFQRFSRRSASASGLGENADGSQVSLRTPSLTEHRPAEDAAGGDDVDVQAGE